MMKFLILFLCISSFQLSANVYSQIAKVSLEVKNASLEQVIQLLENRAIFFCMRMPKSNRYRIWN